MEHSQKFYSSESVEMYNYYNSIPNIPPFTPTYNYSMNSYPFMSPNDQFNSGESQNNQQFVSADKKETITDYSSTPAPTTPSNIKISCDYPTPPEDERSSSSIQFDLNNTDSSDYSKNLNNSDEPRSSSTGRAKRRSRTQYTKQQIDCLEAIFLKSHYPEVHVVDKLSDKLNLSIERISVWFQNRRAKYKKTKKPHTGSEQTLKVHEPHQGVSNSDTSMPNLQSKRNSESPEKARKLNSSTHYNNSSNPDVAAVNNFPSVSYYDQNSQSQYSATYYYDGRSTSAQNSNMNILGDSYQVPFSEYKISENNFYQAYPWYCKST